MAARTFWPIKLFANTRLSHTMRDIHKHGNSIIPTHSSFPATLLRLNAGPTFKPFWFERQTQSNEANHDNSDVWTNCLALNDATLMPNTFMMQEITRTAVENYFEDKENDMCVERPFIFTIPKGTTLPATLVLRRENLSQFSLRPSAHTPSNDLDNILNEFYSKYAEKQEANEWLMDHKYEDAIAAENEKEWMAR
ncbi:hypothetical protein EJ07DRAFT_161282 [Lizonia empirigonia]|nr:hypothetical protein EJ07DRAFT_161282 [Lizonia empirigonia]